MKLSIKGKKLQDRKKENHRFYMMISTASLKLKYDRVNNAKLGTKVIELLVLRGFVRKFSSCS